MTRKPHIFAHRGASTVAPENTLPAFEKALEMGADGIELDTQATADGQLVVLHDYHLERTTTGAGPLRTHTLAQLAGFDAGVRFDSAFSGTPIPTLDQVFDLVGDSCVVNVEIKNMDWDGGREPEPLARLIQRRGLYDRVIVSSFNPIALRKMRQLDPSIPLGLLYFDRPPHPPDGKSSLLRKVRSLPLKDLLLYFCRPWLSRGLAPEALHPYFTSIDAQLIAKARSRGQLVNAWTVNSGAEALRLAALGVDAIITDVPDAIRKELSQAE
ncbi:MAG: glycerophosphodiester phosphodiesterase family protein [Caldilineaceae bacterium]|nr:glycerophosphodiester phosphodiesterase family protein [Caldilineaceae bacterium]